MLFDMLIGKLYIIVLGFAQFTFSTVNFLLILGEYFIFQLFQSLNRVCLYDNVSFPLNNLLNSGFSSTQAKGKVVFASSIVLNLSLCFGSITTSNGF